MLQYTLRRDKPVAVILGIIFFLSGIYTVVQPKMTMLGFSYLIAGLFIFRGLLSIVSHFFQNWRRKREHRKALRREAARIPAVRSGGTPFELGDPADTLKPVKRLKSAERGEAGESTPLNPVIAEYSSIVFGILLILMGGLFLFRPDFTTTLITYFLGFYFLTDGIFAFIYGVRKKTGLGLLYLFLSLFLIAAALLLFFSGDHAILPVYVIIGIALIADGISTGLAPYAK